MGRFNKRLAAAKMVKADKLSLSSSSVLKTAAKKELEVPMLSKPAQMQIMHETASSLKPRKREIVKMNTLSKVTKKDKMKIRKDHLQNRLKAIQMIKNEEKASVRRQRKAIVGDLKPFTGKSLSEAFILTSTNPQYDKRLFIDLKYGFS